MGGAVTRLAFVPPPCQYFDDGTLVWLRTASGMRIPAFHITYPKTNRTLLFSHGNAEDLGLLWDHLMAISSRLKVSLCAYEYPGYGLSEGQPSEHGVYEAADAAFEYLTKHCKLDAARDIILFGRSLGSGPTVDLASRADVRAVILQSPLTSCVRVVLKIDHTFGFDIFPNVDKIRRVQAPVLVIHGTDDEVVPFAHGLTLYKMCANAAKPVWIQGAGHNDIELRWRDLYFRSLEAFLASLPAPPREKQEAAAVSAAAAVHKPPAPLPTPPPLPLPDFRPAEPPVATPNPHTRTHRISPQMLC
eukprot:tig00000319_g24136.t1